jgi:gas vesicle protein GvpL/GvpF
MRARSEESLVLHVYAITDSPVSAQIVGLDGAELRAVGERAPFAVVSEHDRLSAQLREDDLWTHETVVEALMDQATVLPMRFDGAVAGEATLLRILDERQQEFETLLAAVRGAVELGVRAQLSEEPQEDAAGGELAGGQRGGPGTAYLRALAHERRRAADAASHIHEPLAALARRSRQSAAGLKPGLFKAAYLVDRERVDAFRARVEVLDSELGSGRIVCTGPWPPYGFSSEERR